jgi:hypothetical protein
MKTNYGAMDVNLTEKWKVFNAIRILVNLLYTSDRIGSDEIDDIKTAVELLANSEEISRGLSNSKIDAIKRSLRDYER